jgi:beta-mannosidase
LTILLQAGPNELEVSFQSALAYALKQSHAYPYVVPETENYNVWAEPSNRAFVRKAGFDFG